MAFNAYEVYRKSAKTLKYFCTFLTFSSQPISIQKKHGPGKWNNTSGREPPRQRANERT